MLCARSFNPDTEDEDESEHGEANAGEVPVRTDSEDAARLLCDAPEQRPQADQGARPVPYRQGLGEHPRRQGVGAGRVLGLGSLARGMTDGCRRAPVAAMYGFGSGPGPVVTGSVITYPGWAGQRHPSGRKRRQ